MERLNIYQKIAAVMNEVKYVQKKRGKDMPYAAVNHDDVVASLRPAMLKHGLVTTSSVLDWKIEGNQTQCTLSVKFINADHPEEFVEVQSFGVGNDKQDKGPGKAITYAYKYALLKCFMLETGDDDPDLHSINSEKKNTYQGTNPQIEKLKILFNRHRASLSQKERQDLASTFIGRTWDEIEAELNS